MKRRVDVSNCQQTREDYYILNKDMIPGQHSAKVPKDYRDRATGTIIWAVSRNKRTGIVVANDSETYNKPNWQTLWLR